MARKGGKRKREEVREVENNIHQQSTGHEISTDITMGGILSSSKKPRLSPEFVESNSMSRATDSTILNREFGHDEAEDKIAAQLPQGDDGWRIVESKLQRQNKRRGPDNEKVKYPELVFHGKNSVPIRIADLQNLVLYTLADGVGPSWLAFKHAIHTRKVVVLMVPGLEKGMFDGSIDLAGGAPTSRTSDRGDAQENPGNEKDELESWKHGKPLKQPQVWQGTPTSMSQDNLPQLLQPITEMFDEVWPIKAPGDSKMAKIHSPLQAMLISPIPASKVSNTHKGPRPPAEEKSFRANRTPITEFVHTADELQDAQYPIHAAVFTSTEDARLEAQRRSETKQSVAHGWADTYVTTSLPVLPPQSRIQAGSMTQGLDVYALDCEMVQTTDDVYSLARISIVDWSGKTILDSFVKPSLPIKNYWTQYSGITPELLANVTTTLPDIQAKLLQLCTPSTILIGHSLESDFNAMKLTHPFIVDTGIIYPHPRGLPLRSSLKFLTQKYLHREIQNASDSKGHNSVEDAIAVLDLVKLKCEKGPKWGTSEASGEPIFRRLGRTPGRDNNPRTSALVDFGTPERGYGKEATVTIGCENDAEIVQGVIRAVNGDSDGKVVRGGGVDFTWARMRELESWRGWSNNNRDYSVVDQLHGNGNATTAVDGPIDSDTILPEAEPGSNSHTASTAKTTGLLTTVGQTIAHIKTIYNALPPCTLFIVYSGTGDPREVGRLQKMQTQYKKEFKVKKWDDLSIKWTDDEEQALHKAVEKARNGCGFLCVK